MIRPIREVKNLEPIRDKKNYLYLSVLSLLLLLPAFFGGYIHLNSLSFYEILINIFLSLLLLTVPLFFFYRNIKIYFWLLLPFVIISPLILFSIIIFNVEPGWLFVSLILQTNISEAKEIAAGYIFYFLPIEIIYVFLYIWALKKLSITLVSLRKVAAISFGSFLAAFGYFFFKHQLTLKGENSIKKYYPVSLIGGVANVMQYKVALDTAGFTFNAIKKDSLTTPQIHVLIIGESSRYDRWQINGYNKKTSPHLEQQKELIVFPNMMAGAHVTWMAVPQLITRTMPDKIDLQFHEKSILSVFKDVHFRTAWLSNQSDHELYFSGTTPIHAKTADYSIFSPNSSGLEIVNIYDERLLPLLDSFLSSSTKNSFIVLHTMGSHFDYSKRYPDNFDLFKPSGKQHSIKQPSSLLKDVVSNSYDNSILYTDFIIDSIIKTVDKHNAISSVTYISDHGENLFDLPGKKFDAHTQPSYYSLHVPFFIWTSQAYAQYFPEKRKMLLSNKGKRLGVENVFYTLLDLANIGFPTFDSGKSIISHSFIESRQQYYDLQKNGPANPILSTHQ